MKHYLFNEVKSLTGIEINNIKVPVLLTGEAGLGKSTIIEQLAKEMDLPYYYIAGSGQTSESKLLGYKIEDKVVETLFTEAYQNGGIFCLEEMDAIPSSVLVSLNTAIVSNYGSFAGRIVDRHKDFYMFATTNTYKGATETYSGRNTLDQSTLERYYKVEIKLDLELEKNIFSEDDYNMIQYFRKAVNDSFTISTRQASMFLGLKGRNLIQSLEMTLFRNHPEQLSVLKDKFLKDLKPETLPIITKKEYMEITKYNY